MKAADTSETNRIIGIDRLDYTKGLPQKFRAYGKFLEEYPDYRRRIVLSQFAPPTRESVEAYADIKAELESLAGSINGRFGELDWVPINYIHRTIPRAELRDVYRSSRIGWVTPLMDGMNLVAKEFIACQDPADPGVLILSKFAGAAAQLADAVLVNPYDLNDMVQGLRIALEMPLDERLRAPRPLAQRRPEKQLKRLEPQLFFRSYESGATPRRAVAEVIARDGASSRTIAELSQKKHPAEPTNGQRGDIMGVIMDRIQHSQPG